MKLSAHTISLFVRRNGSFRKLKAKGNGEVELHNYRSITQPPPNTRWIYYIRCTNRNKVRLACKVAKESIALCGMRVTFLLPISLFLTERCIGLLCFKRIPDRSPLHRGALSTPDYVTPACDYTIIASGCVFLEINPWSSVPGPSLSSQENRLCV